MSIKQGQEIKQLQLRIEELERKVNLLNVEPRTVGGTLEPEAPKPKRGRPKKVEEPKTEGDEG